MKRKFLELVAATVPAGLAMVVFAGRAVANSSAYAFTMKLRYVSGRDNNRPHTLDAGELTLSGQIWATNKSVRSTSTPQPITIEVAKPGLFSPVPICTLSVMPDVILNSKRPYSRSCGRIEGGTYWIIASKSKTWDKSGDGWRIQGSGTLTTK